MSGKRIACPAVLAILMIFGILLPSDLLHAAVSWHHPLYLGRGGIWRQRIPVVIRNTGAQAVAGRSVGIAVGNAPGELPLAGVGVEAVRVINGDGIDVLYAVTDPHMELVKRGPVPEASLFTIPGECPANAEVTYYLYFDNPNAWGVPDFLKVSSKGSLNGGFENGDADQPSGWSQKDVDSEHRNTWVTVQPHEGSRCLQTSVDAGAQANWVAYYRPGMTIIPGADYEITGWVRGENVVGRAGWFLHVASDNGGPQAINRVEEAGQGTFAWRQIRIAFHAPDDALSMTVGTVLRGTGTAWFDDLQITTDSEDTVTAQVGVPERFSLDIQDDPAWHASIAEGWDERVPLTVTNSSDTALDDVLGYVDLSSVSRGGIGLDSLLVMDGKNELASCLLDGRFLFRVSVPPRTVKQIYLYQRQAVSAESVAHGQPRSRLGSDIPSDQVLVENTNLTDTKAYAGLLASPANLVTNPSFEEGNPLPDAWPGNAENGQARGVVYRTSSPGAFGSRCAEFSVPHDNSRDWVGWRQDVPVKPGHSYLLAAWLKCTDIQDGTVKLHAHRRKPDGQLCSDSPYLSVGTNADGTGDWFPCVGMVPIPVDGGILQVHLTMNATGTLAHDGVIVTEVVSATVGTRETQARDSAAALAVWPVNPIVKVFRETLPPETPEPLSVELARNESEPLQIAVRANRSLAGVKVNVTPPADAAGHSLTAIEITRVGYVPIDHKTSYYRSDTPVWHRKYPTGSGSCDGWAGWWPDPLLPENSLDLEPGRTQAVWITFSSTSETPAGSYSGQIEFRQDDKVILNRPYTLQVWDFTLPTDTHLAAIYDVRAGGQWQAGGKKAVDVRHAIMRKMASRRLCADRVRTTPKFTRDGDRILADFSEYDSEADIFFGELNFPRSYTPGFFYLFGWAHPPRSILGEAPYEGKFPYEDADRGQLRPAYKRVYQECLRQYWTHMKEKGWADRIVLYISDEPHFSHEHIRRQMQALCDMIHEAAPDIPIYSSTWRHCPEWDGHLDVWGVGQYGCFPVEEMETRSAAGDRLWFTTDGQMCTDTPYCAIERLLPHYCFKYKVEAYEFWGVDWLTYDPYEFGWHSYIRQSSTPGEFYYVRYPNGDGFLLYPGTPAGQDEPVSSIRFEQAREGVEDYEYLYLLQNLAAAKGDVEAEKVLTEASELVTIPNAGGRFSTKILPDPDAVPRLRRRLAAEIVRLSAGQ